MDFIVFIPKDVVTGGPEASHQLSNAIYSLNSEMDTIKIFSHFENIKLIKKKQKLYISSQTSLKIKIKLVLKSFFKFFGYKKISQKSVYKKYVKNINYVDEAEINKNSICVIPEVLPDIAVLLAPVCKIIFWWLSVDNFYSKNHNISSFVDLRHPSIYHAYQSIYAKKFLLLNGIKESYQLTDYTNCRPKFLQEKYKKRKKTILINPKKQSKITNVFLKEIEKYYEIIPLIGLNSDEINKYYRENTIYLELGHSPGKDRMAREASSLGCIVFYLKAGAAQYEKDLNLDDYYLFDPIKIVNIPEEYIKRIKSVFKRPIEHWENQEVFRISINSEKAKFFDETSKLIEIISKRK